MCSLKTLLLLRKQHRAAEVGAECSENLERGENDVKRHFSPTELPSSPFTAVGFVRSRGNVLRSFDFKNQAPAASNSVACNGSGEFMRAMSLADGCY